MSEGVKTGLIVAGVAVVGYVLYSRFASPSSLPVTAGLLQPTGSATSAAPGTVTATSVAQTAGSALGSSLATGAIVAFTGPIGLATTSTGRAVLSAAGGAAKAVGSGVVSGVESAGSAVKKVFSFL